MKLEIKTWLVDIERSIHESTIGRSSTWQNNGYENATPNLPVTLMTPMHRGKKSLVNRKERIKNQMLDSPDSSFNYVSFRVTTSIRRRLKK